MGWEGVEGSSRVAGSGRSEQGEEGRGLPFISVMTVCLTPNHPQLREARGGGGVSVCMCVQS